MSDTPRTDAAQRECGAMPAPANYQVWYGYMSEECRKLERELTAINHALYTENQLADDNFRRDPIPTIRVLKLYARLDRLSNLTREVSEWAEATFPGQTAKSKAQHLLDEAAELLADPTDGEEMADVLLLLLHIAKMAGVNLIEAARVKLEINRKRQWGAADARGVHKHV